MGAELLRGWGGRVMLVDLKQDHLPSAAMQTLKI